MERPPLQCKKFTHVGPSYTNVYYFVRSNANGVFLAILYFVQLFFECEFVILTFPRNHQPMKRTEHYVWYTCSVGSVDDLCLPE